VAPIVASHFFARLQMAVVLPEFSRDFERIAAAYLAGVELPAYGPRKTSREVAQI
jgi:hypothetical protein